MSSYWPSDDKLPLNENGHGQGPIFNFGAPVMSLEWVKLESSNTVPLE